MLQWFEKLVNPYPSKGLNEPLPTRFFPFVWQAATGVRPYLLLLVLFTAGAASFEATVNYENATAVALENYYIAFGV